MNTFLEAITTLYSEYKDDRQVNSFDIIMISSIPVPAHAQGYSVMDLICINTEEKMRKSIPTPPDSFPCIEKIKVHDSVKITRISTLANMYTVLRFRDPVQVSIDNDSVITIHAVGSGVR